MSLHPKAFDVSTLEAIQQKLSSLGNPKLMIIIRKKKFLTDLENFDVSGIVSILLIAEKASSNLSSRTRNLMDFIFTFKLHEQELKPIWRDLSSTSFAEPTALIDELLRNLHINRKRVYLIANEEPTLYYVSDIRSRFGLAGYGSKEMARFLDKQSMKSRAFEHNIRTAGTFLLSSEIRNRKNITEVQSEILRELKLPFFIKPRFGCALVGTRTIKNQSELTDWLESTEQEPFPYLIEEQLNGTEYAAYMLVQDSKILFATYFKNVYPISHFVHDSLPLAKIQLVPNDHFCPRYDDFKRFSEQVVDAFQPSNGIFSFQAFDDPLSKDFFLIETSSRLPGGLFTSLTLQTTGISVESLHIILQVDEKISESALEDLKCSSKVAYIRYPRKLGVVEKLNPVPESEVLRNVKWYVKEGDQLDSARALAHRHEALAVELWDEDYQKLTDFFTFLAHNYQPLKLKSNQ